MSQSISVYLRSFRQIFTLFLLCSICLGSALAQSFQLSFKHLTPESGLSQSVNYHMVKDSRGFVWIGSEDGLNRFDGSNCKIFAPDAKASGNIIGKDILGIVAAQNGDLWIGTENGLQNRKSDQNKFTQINLDNPASKVPAIPLGELMGGNILVLQPQNGKVSLVGGKDYKINVLPERLPVEDIKRVFTSRGFIGSDSTLFILTDQKLYSISWTAGKLGSLRGLNKTVESRLGRATNIQAICAQGDSVLWLATNKGLFRYFTARGNIDLFNNTSGRVCKDITCLSIGRSGVLYAGTLNDGCLVFRIEKNQIIQHFRNNLADQESLGGNAVNSILTDSLYNVWIGLDLVGVDYANFQKRKFLVWPEPPSTGNFFVRPEIHTLAVDSSGNIWTGNKTKGIIVYNRNRQFLKDYHGHSKGGPLPGEGIRHILVDRKNQVWIATDQGLTRHPGGTTTWELARNTDRESIRNPQFLIQNANADILCLAEGGIWRKRVDKEATFEKIINIPPDINLPTFFYQDSLLGIVIPPFGQFKEKNGVWSKIAEFNVRGVNSMLWDTLLNSHWMGTDNGLMLLDGKTKQITTYAESDGLANSHINGMILDFYGNLWMGTNKGIIRFKVRKEDFLKKSKARNYVIADGLQDNSYGRFAASVESTGHFLFGGLKGFNSFDPLRLFDYGQMPRIAITGIEINDRDSIPPGQINQIEELVLKPFQTSFAIYFSGVDYADPHSIRYRVRLDDYDQEWITKKEGLVRYSNLKPGTYTLKIKAANSDGQWTPESRNLTVIIRPPFWNYWFVKLFAFFLLVASTYLLVHTNTERQLEKQRIVFERQQAITEERTRIAADMHDDLGSGLSMISLMSSLAKDKAKDPDQANSIDQIGITANELIDKMGEIIWTLNSKNDTLESLLRYLRQFASKLFDVTEIEWSMTVQDQLPEMTCSGKIRRNIFLTSKEALHNIVKHSKSTKTNIQASIHENVFIISISDNGKGIDASKINQFGNGLTNMRKRIEDIGGQFIMHSNQGTEILIRLPVELFERVTKDL